MRTLLLFFGLMTSYIVIAGFGWSWALGLDFAAWKLIVVGAINAAMTMFMNGLIRFLNRTEKQTVSN